MSLRGSRQWTWRWLLVAAAVGTSATVQAADPAGTAVTQGSGTAGSEGLGPARAAAAAFERVLAASQPRGSSPLAAPLPLAALEAYHQGDVSACDSLLERASRAGARDPLLWLARIHRAWWAILADGDPAGTLEPALQADFEHLQEIATARLAADPNDDVAAFALGEGHCTLGRLAGLRGELWGALRHHQRGVPLLEGVCRRSPGSPEPLASLGVYRYYTARLPRSLRVLARLVRVRGDRVKGLEDLRRAASMPGAQQLQAAFFLTEILSHSEDETLEALALARRFHARYPRHLGFTLELADVLAALERPDLALQALAESPADDPGRSAQVKLFSARVLLESGRPGAALARLAALEAAERDALGWLESWYDVIRGASLAALGRVPEGLVHLERAEAAQDVAGSRGAARAARELCDDPLWPARTAAESLLAWDGDPEAARRTLEAALARHPRRAPDAASCYHLGAACLRAGDARAAAAHFTAAARCDAGDEVRLRVRPAIRRLQALQWAGEIDAARAAAHRIAPELGQWGTNRQLELLVGDLLQGGTAAVRLHATLPASGGELLRLKDTGFTCVTVCVRGARRTDRVPMTLRQGYWEARLAPTDGDILYAFEVEGGELVVDPGAPEVVDLAGTLWSRRPSPARPS